MDPYKVDSVLNWKTPTNRDLHGFLGSVGYLADDIPNVRIPMGVLHRLTGDTVPFHWGLLNSMHLKMSKHSCKRHATTIVYHLTMLWTPHKCGW